MKQPLIRKGVPKRKEEQGITIVLVALIMVAVMAMAALSIDVVTLYLANAEAQRAADVAALAGARVLSLSGITGDPNNDRGGWAAACTLATQVATAVASQNTMGSAPVAPGAVSVSFLDRNGAIDCTQPGPVAFGVNPEVQVKIQRTDLPTFFARIWGRQGNSVSATATAEVYNSSDAKDFTASALQVPVQPRCVKPWLVANRDPVPPTLPTFVSPADGDITTKGVSQLGGGVIGETFLLAADCVAGAPDCTPPANLSDNPPIAKTVAGKQVLEYIPALIQTPISAVPAACPNTTDYQKAIAGCDQTTVYACGTTDGATADLTLNPGGFSGDTATAVQCLTQSAVGADTLNTNNGLGPVFPFQIQAGRGNPLVVNGLVSQNSVLTSSNSVVTVPIYRASVVLAGTNPAVTVVGFLQLFINGIATSGDPKFAGDVTVTVLNITGCGTTGANPVTGTSPVPIRLVTNQ